MIDRRSAKRKCLLPLACVLVATLPSFAQTGMKSERLTPDQGLSHRWVFETIQDSRGFLWMATADGLNRYDGHEFKIFRHVENDSNSLSENHLRGVAESRNGEIWVRTLGNGNEIFDPKTETFRRAKLEKDAFLPPDHALCGSHFFMPHGLGKNQSARFSGGKDTLASRLRQLANGFWNNSDLPSITLEKDGTLWIWASRGIYKNLPADWAHYARFDAGQKSWAFFWLDESVGFKPGHRSLPIDAKGRYWFPSAHAGGGWLFKTFDLPVGIPLRGWLTFRLDNKRNIWLLTLDRKLFRYEAASGKVEFFTQLERDGFSVMEDKEGIIWISTENGILKIKQRKNLFENYLNQPFEPGGVPPIGCSMAGMAEGGYGRVYFHQYNGKTFSFDPRTKTVTTLPFADKTRGLLLAQDGSLWLTCDNGFWRRKPNGSFELFDRNAPTSLFEDGKGRLWATVAKNGVLLLFDPASQTFQPSGISTGTYLEFYFFQKEKNLLWANKDKGLVKINLEIRQSETLELFEEKDPRFVRCWLPDGDKMWLATQKGLMLFDPAAKRIIRTWTTAQGLPNDVVYFAVPDDTPLEGGGGVLWLGTNNGLCRFNKRTQATRNFFVEDGLSHHEFNSKSYLKTTDGKIWTGGLNGINAFFPKDLEKTSAPAARLSFTKFSKYNRAQDTLLTWEMHRLDSLTIFPIRPNEQSVTFQFTLTSLSDPARNRYFWYLEGFEPAWAHHENKPVANYQNLPPGRYVLHVKAADYQGNPAENELAITVRVYQVWYKQWWAILLAAAAVAAAVFMFYRLQLERKLEHREAERLKELDAFKSRLYANITHEFRTPLTVILGMTEQLESSGGVQPAAPGAGGGLNPATTIRRNGENLLRLINQMLDLSKLEAGAMPLDNIRGDVVSFLKYLVESFHSLAGAKNIALRFQSEMSECEMDFDPEKMQQVVSNLLSNAVKFTPEGGEIFIETSAGAVSTLFIKVRDTGIGIAETHLPQVFDRFYQAQSTVSTYSADSTGGTGIGLALVKELVKLMGGEVSVKSELGKGSEFVVALPVSRQASPLDLLKGEPKSPHPADFFDKITSELPDAGSPFRGSGGDGDGDHPLVLLIEDHADVAAYIRYCLEGEYPIALARNGREGIERALEIIPDLIVSDVMMPEKDGFEVVQTLKNDERTSHIPIILLTAKADIASKIEGLERGADAYLAKPFHKKELQVRLRNLLETRRRLQERYARNDPEFLGVISAPADDKALQIEDAFLQKIKLEVEKRLDEAAFDVPHLSRYVGMSQSQLYRKIKALTGKSTAAFIRLVRLQKGKELLRTTDLTISEIAYEVGFSTPNYFSDAFFEEFGERPTEARN